jgi:hypothetical protein
MAITLTEVETAIQQVETSGQGFTVDGVTYNRANLSALLALRDTLQRNADRESGARPVFRGFQFNTLGYD